MRLDYLVQVFCAFVPWLALLASAQPTFSYNFCPADAPVPGAFILSITTCAACMEASYTWYYGESEGTVDTTYPGFCLDEAQWSSSDCEETSDSTSRLLCCGGVSPGSDTTPPCACARYSVDYATASVFDSCPGVMPTASPTTSTIPPTDPPTELPTVFPTYPPCSTSPPCAQLLQDLTTDPSINVILELNDATYTDSTLDVSELNSQLYDVSLDKDQTAFFNSGPQTCSSPANSRRRGPLAQLALGAVVALVLAPEYPVAGAVLGGYLVVKGLASFVANTPVNLLNQAIPNDQTTIQPNPQQQSIQINLNGLGQLCQSFANHVSQGSNAYQNENTHRKRSGNFNGFGVATSYTGSNISISIALGNNLYQYAVVQFIDSNTNQPISLNGSVRAVINVTVTSQVTPTPTAEFASLEQLVSIQTLTYISAGFGVWCLLWFLVSFLFQAYNLHRKGLLSNHGSPWDENQINSRLFSVIVALIRPLLVVPCYIVGLAEPISALFFGTSIILFVTQGILGRRLAVKHREIMLKMSGLAIAVRYLGIQVGISVFLIGLAYFVVAGLCNPPYLYTIGPVEIACFFLSYGSHQIELAALCVAGPLAIEAAVHICAASSLFRLSYYTNEPPHFSVVQSMEIPLGPVPSENLK